jgi:hypothetical protein
MDALIGTGTGIGHADICVLFNCIGIKDYTRQWYAIMLSLIASGEADDIKYILVPS